jgi:predicted nucleotidyltransferase
MAVDITLDRLKTAVIKLAELTGENRFVLIGRATLAITAPTPFQEFARSDDIDLWPEGNEDASLDLCIQQMGEASPFHIQNGFYVERVGSWTLLTQPVGWLERSTKLAFDGIEIIALGLLDLAYNKLEANRQKDRDFLRAAFEAGLIDLLELKKFIHLHAPNDFVREKLAGYLNNLLG